MVTLTQKIRPPVPKQWQIVPWRATKEKHTRNTHAVKRHASTTTGAKNDDTIKKFIKFSARGYLLVVLLVDTTKMRTTYTQRKGVR